MSSSVSVSNGGKLFEGISHFAGVPRRVITFRGRHDVAGSARHGRHDVTARACHGRHYVAASA